MKQSITKNNNNVKIVFLFLKKIVKLKYQQANTSSLTKMSRILYAYIEPSSRYVI